MLGVIEHGEQSGVDHRMQGLHAAVEDLGETGDVRDLARGDVVLLQERECAARGDDLDAPCMQCRGKGDEPAFVRNADESPANERHSYSWDERM